MDEEVKIPEIETENEKDKIEKALNENLKKAENVISTLTVGLIFLNIFSIAVLSVAVILWKQWSLSLFFILPVASLIAMLVSWESNKNTKFLFPHGLLGIIYLFYRFFDYKNKKSNGNENVVTYHPLVDSEKINNIFKR